MLLIGIWELPAFRFTTLHFFCEGYRLSSTLSRRNIFEKDANWFAADYLTAQRPVTLIRSMDVAKVMNPNSWLVLGKGK